MNHTAAEPQIEVYRTTRQRDAEEHALVLTAVGIACTMHPLDGVVTLLVPTSEALRARQQLVQYTRENRGHSLEEPQRKDGQKPQPRRLIDGLPGAVGCAGVLVVLHAWSRQGAFFQAWLPAGAAQAKLILGGEWWRTITALGLHVDLSHLASNVVFGIVFGLLVAQIFGSGLGWLAILLGGAAGNLLNAVIQPETHTAVGASTAVFAAIGILSGAMLRRKQFRRARGLRRWTPLAGGLMLLVYLGIGGERTDVGSHFAGFAMGVLGGVILAQVSNQLPQGPYAQRVSGAAATLLFVVAWTFALRTYA